MDLLVIMLRLIWLQVLWLQKLFVSLHPYLNTGICFVHGCFPRQCCLLCGKVLSCQFMNSIVVSVAIPIFSAALGILQVIGGMSKSYVKLMLNLHVYLLYLFKCYKHNWPFSTGRASNFLQKGAKSYLFHTKKEEKKKRKKENKQTNIVYTCVSCQFW